MCTDISAFLEPVNYCLVTGTVVVVVVVAARGETM
jgi:hypothetical protein